MRGPLVSYLRVPGVARYAIATRTVLTDGASFRLATRTTRFVFTDRSTTWDLPVLLTSVMRSLATFAELFTLTVRKRPSFVVTTCAETSVILTVLAVFAGVDAAGV